ncbi:hypothetical protein [Methanosarcina horonobensis]|uniref:hypothetical protein n=1 Tax=Methanosarcina horonobensis TaxID=418008 RepID=UPI00064E26F6|nr:hypothetical protein [Methanosarcina horonobensis]
MRHQKVPEPEGRRSYSSPVHPAAYKQGLNHSSQNFLFRYSVIEAGPLKYGSNSTQRSIEYTDTSKDSRYSDLLAEADLTMSNPDIYLECTGKLSESSDIQHSVEKIIR